MKFVLKNLIWPMIDLTATNPFLLYPGAITNSGFCNVPMYNAL